MGFVKYHDRIKDYNFSPDCTIFNYDTTYFLCKDGPLVYDHGIGGYIEPRLGGNLNQPDWFYFKKTIEGGYKKSDLVKYLSDTDKEALAEQDELMIKMNNEGIKSLTQSK